MTDDPLARVQLESDMLPDHAQWAAGLVVSLPAEICRRLKAADSGLENQWLETSEALRLRAAFTPTPPVSARLPVSYQHIPGPLRRLLAGAIGRLQRTRQTRWSDYPGWPIDLSADVAADLGGVPQTRFARTPVLLSHDIDSLEGLQNLARKFIAIEERAGARSANYIVPCAWPLDHGLIGEVSQRGHEIGVHGYNHSNRTPFLDAPERLHRLSKAHQMLQQYGIAGYRAPSLLRTRALIADLAHFFRYDASIPTSGGAFPVPNNGCASARPWQFGELWEIPLSMPRDGSLRFLGYSPRQIGAIWRQCADAIARSRGVMSLLTHCEAAFSGNEAMLGIYSEFLGWIAGDQRFEFVRPTDLIVRLEMQSGEATVH